MCSMANWKAKEKKQSGTGERATEITQSEKQGASKLKKTNLIPIWDKNIQ